MDSYALAGSRSTICHTDSYTLRGPRDAATWDKTMRPQSADHLPGKGRRPGGCRRRERREGMGRGAGGGGRSAFCPGPSCNPNPQSSVLRGGESGARSGPRGRGSLASDSSKDVLVERPLCPAPPGRLEDRPRLRAYWDRVAPSLGASRKFGLRERVRQAGKAPAGAMRTDRGRRESGPGCHPRAPRVRLGRRGASRGIGRV